MRRVGRRSGWRYVYNTKQSWELPIGVNNWGGSWERCPMKLDNHSQQSGKCTRPRCGLCHLHPVNKSAGKARGQRKHKGGPGQFEDFVLELKQPATTASRGRAAWADETWLDDEHDEMELWQAEWRVARLQLDWQCLLETIAVHEVAAAAPDAPVDSVADIVSNMDVEFPCEWEEVDAADEDEVEFEIGEADWELLSLGSMAGECS